MPTSWISPKRLIMEGSLYGEDGSFLQHASSDLLWTILNSQISIILCLLGQALQQGDGLAALVGWDQEVQRRGQASACFQMAPKSQKWTPRDCRFKGTIFQHTQVVLDSCKKSTRKSKIFKDVFNGCGNEYATWKHAEQTFDRSSPSGTRPWIQSATCCDLHLD